MMKYFLLLLTSFFISNGAKAQLHAGPVTGYTTPTSCIVWFQCFRAQMDSVVLIDRMDKSIVQPDSMQRWRVGGTKTVKAYFNNLSTTSKYLISFQKLDKKKYKLPIPDYNKEDFSFLVGSCVLTLPMPARSIYPGKRIEIFNTMKKDTGNDFMLWTGDYVYYLKQHLGAKNRMFHRMNNQRVMFPEINSFQSTISNYAVWDDHDFGSNNVGAEFVNKKWSKEVFNMQWPNPPSPGDSTDSGIYFHVKHKDIDLFMMDCRFNKTTVGEYKSMWGKTQMKWLKENLKASKSTFKFIINGSQMLTKSRPKSSETFYYHRLEYDELLKFIKTNKIEGVVFISGDIHSSEILKLEDKGMYPLYEYTCSALTSIMYGGFHNKEVLPGYREYLKNNYGKISIETKGDHRVCVFKNYDGNGKLNWEYSFSSEDLKFKK